MMIYAGSLLSLRQVSDVCGLAHYQQQSYYSSGQGVIGAKRVLQRLPLAWDNHFIAFSPSFFPT